MPVDTYSEREPPVYKPREPADVELMRRPRFMRLFARMDKVTYSVQNSEPLFELGVAFRHFGKK